MIIINVQDVYITLDTFYCTIRFNLLNLNCDDNVFYSYSCEVETIM